MAQGVDILTIDRMIKIDRINMNEYYNEPEIIVLQDHILDDLSQKELRDITRKQIDETNWLEESRYHNAYYNKGKYGSREIRMNNKEWHEKNN